MGGKVYLVLTLCAVSIPLIVQGHGYMYDPPQRSTMWRKGFPVPVNYNDNELNCGGFAEQWANDGKCGACGDPYLGPIENDNNGLYDTGIIAKTYTQGAFITITVYMTVVHRGYFTFRLCDDGSLKLDALQECLDDRVLQLTTGSERYYVGENMGTYEVVAKLPNDVVCDHCVLQWRYRAGNNWGVDENGSGLGFGKQEHFINCADIKIVQSGTPIETSLQPPPPTTVATTTNENEPPPPPTPPPTSADCEATEFWKSVPGMNEWCATNCAHAPPNCPASHCVCP